MEPEYIIGNDKRNHDLISSMPPSPLKLLRVMPSQCILIIPIEYPDVQQVFIGICKSLSLDMFGYVLYIMQQSRDFYYDIFFIKESFENSFLPPLVYLEDRKMRS